MSDILKFGVTAFITGMTFLYILFANFIPHAYGLYSDRRIFLNILMICVVVGCFFSVREKFGLRDIRSAISPFFVLIFCFLLAIIQFNDDPFYLVEPILYVLYFFAFSILGYCLSRTQGLSGLLVSFMTVLAVACFFYAAMTITVYLFAITDDFSQLDRVIPWGFVNIRYWSHIATWVVPLLPLAILLGPLKINKLWRTAAAFTAAIWWWMLLMSASRGSLIGLFIGFVFVSVLFGRASWPWVAMSLKYVVYGVIAWLILSLLIPSLVFDELQIRSIGGDSSGRMPLWQEAWAMSLQNFPFGMGPQSWLTHDIITEAYRNSSKFGHPHNMYLMWAAEYGWLSVLGLAIGGLVALNRLMRKRSAILDGTDHNGLAVIAFTASVTGALVHAGVSAVFIAPASMLVGLLVLSLFWGLIHSQVSAGERYVKSPQSAGTRALRYALLLLVVCGCGLWMQKVVQYHQAMEADLPYYQENVRTGALPRFWFHGNFPRRPEQMP